MKQYFILSAIAMFAISVANAQFAPPVGQAGTTAIFKDSSVFVSWATSCVVNRGLQDISNTSLGYANVGDSSNVYGKAGTTGVVSLGDGGSAIISFSTPIVDGPGPDLAVFENSFNDTFLELAFVEASSDGSNFFRFPAVSNIDTTIQTDPFGSTDATKINNLAGKYRANYGTPFDLADIPDNLLLDKQAITHIKVIDVVGCIQKQYCTRDVNNHIINDPWPTAFGSSGFDLDAIGVINQKIDVGVEELNIGALSVYPNPAKNVLFINSSFNEYTLSIVNVVGVEVLKKQSNLNFCQIPLNELVDGVYLIYVSKNEYIKQLKFIKQSN